MTPELPSGPDTRENDPSRAKAMAYGSKSIVEKRAALLGDAQAKLDKVLRAGTDNPDTEKALRDLEADIPRVVAEAASDRLLADLAADHAGHQYDEEKPIQAKLDAARAGNGAARVDDIHRAEAEAYGSDNAETKRAELLGEAQAALNVIAANRDPNDPGIETARQTLLDSIDGIILQANELRAFANESADQANSNYNTEVSLQNQLNEATGKPEIKSEYEKTQEAKEQIEAMKQWLIASNAYDDAGIDQIFDRLSVKYDKGTDQAVVNGHLNLDGLTSAEGLKFPTTINGSLNLDGLTSAEGLKFPTTISGSLYLNNLTSAEDLTLPTIIGGSLKLGSLTSVEGLKLPTTVSGSLYLNNLTSAEGLTLPTIIGGGVNLNGLPRAEKTAFHAKYPDIRIF